MVVFFYTLMGNIFFERTGLNPTHIVFVAPFIENKKVLLLLLPHPFKFNLVSSFFIYFTKRKHLKLWKTFFILQKKIFSFSSYLNCCTFFFYKINLAILRHHFTPKQEFKNNCLILWKAKKACHWNLLNW